MATALAELREVRVKRKKVVMVLPDFRGGGVERVRISLAKEFDRLGVDTEFLVMNDEGELAGEARSVSNVQVLGVHRMRSLFVGLLKYFRLNRSSDAVMAAMWPLTVIVPVAARLSGFKGAVLVSEHNTLSHQYRDWGRVHSIALRLSLRWGYRLASARVGVSQGVVTDLMQLSGLPQRLFSIIYNPLSPRPPPNATDVQAAESVWGSSGRRVVCVGSLKDQKNHQVLLRAIAQTNTTLTIVGAGQNEGKLRLLASELGIADRVNFVGFHADPSSFYATADLFVLSSDYEGFGNVIVEALSFGLPVVSTDCPSGPSEILENGKWGRLVPVGDAEALARAIEEALAAPVDRDALKRRAADFSPEIAARKYLDVMGLA